mgnify:CR=1 FL=1
MSNEIWKHIPEWEGIYQASSLGRIKSLDKIVKSKTGKRTVKGRILKLVMRSRDTYRCVSLSDNNCSNLFSVHRLIALSFIPNPNNLPQVNHKDRNKENNSVDNLEWCTASENTIHATGIEIDMIKGGKIIKTYRTISDAGRDGFSITCISECIIGKNSIGISRKTHRGYTWKKHFKREPVCQPVLFG